MASASQSVVVRPVSRTTIRPRRPGGSLLLLLLFACCGRNCGGRFQPDGRPEPVSCRSAEACALVDSRRGIFRVGGFLYPAIGTGARAEGECAPDAGMVWGCSRGHDGHAGCGDCRGDGTVRCVATSSARPRIPQRPVFRHHVIRHAAWTGDRMARQAGVAPALPGAGHVLPARVHLSAASIICSITLSSMFAWMR